MINAGDWSPDLLADSMVRFASGSIIAPEPRRAKPVSSELRVEVGDMLSEIEG